MRLENIDVSVRSRHLLRALTVINGTIVVQSLHNMSVRLQYVTDIYTKILYVWVGSEVRVQRNPHPGTAC